MQVYAQQMQEFKDSAGLEETSVGYVVAGHLGGGPKSAQYGLLKKGHVDDKEQKKLNKCPSVRASPPGTPQSILLSNSASHVILRTGWTSSKVCNVGMARAQVLLGIAIAS